LSGLDTFFHHLGPFWTIWSKKNFWHFLGHFWPIFDPCTYVQFNLGIFSQFGPFSLTSTILVKPVLHTQRDLTPEAMWVYTMAIGCAKATGTDSHQYAKNGHTDFPKMGPQARFPIFGQFCTKCRKPFWWSSCYTSGKTWGPSPCALIQTCNTVQNAQEPMGIYSLLTGTAASTRWVPATFANFGRFWPILANFAFSPILSKLVLHNKKDLRGGGVCAYVRQYACAKRTGNDIT
jgi:hypothetical protein